MHSFIPCRSAAAPLQFIRALQRVATAPIRSEQHSCTPSYHAAAPLQFSHAVQQAATALSRREQHVIPSYNAAAPQRHCNSAVPCSGSPLLPCAGSSTRTHHTMP